MREVTGSSPVVSTKKTHPFLGVFFWYYTALTTELEGRAALKKGIANAF